MDTDSANRSVSEHSDADDVIRIGTSLSYCQATGSDGLDWMIRCCRSALLHQCNCYSSCCSRCDTGFSDCPTRLSPVVRFPPRLAFCLGCRIPCLYTNAWGLGMEFELDSESVRGCFSPLVRFPQCLANCLGCRRQSLYTNAFGLETVASAFTM